MKNKASHQGKEDRDVTASELKIHKTWNLFSKDQEHLIKPKSKEKIVFE